MDRIFVIFRRGLSAPEVRTLHIDPASDDAKLEICEQVKRLMDVVPDFGLLACVSEGQEIALTRDEWRAFLHV